jgi:tetratricopeptide (TPR) repeat protein
MCVAPSKVMSSLQTGMSHILSWRLHCDCKRFGNTLDSPEGTAMKRKWYVMWVSSIVLLWVAAESSVMVLRPESVNAAETIAEDADHWLDRGGLLLTYGNYEAAIRCYQKAIELEPLNVQAHFNLGVSYGELGDHGKAIEVIDRSIELDPENGKFFFGRGRVFLLAGKKEKAMADFLTAAELGSQDARDYLEYIKQFVSR